MPSNLLTPFPSDDIFPTTGGERGTTRDAYLDNCKFALMILIGVGHSLQWLLATEDRRTGRLWCGADALDDSSEDGVAPSSAVVPALRALYTWSNAIAIPMFCVVSGRLSRSLVAGA